MASRYLPPPSLVPDASTLPVVAPVPTSAQQVQFLEAVTRGATQHHAAADLDLPLLSFGMLKRSDSQFASALAVALELRNDARAELLEGVAHEYAVHGVSRDRIVGKGDSAQVVQITEFNAHALLQFLLKGTMREKYGTEHTKLDANITDAPFSRLPGSEADAKKLLARVDAELRKMLPAIESTAVEVKPDDGSDLV